MRLSLRLSVGWTPGSGVGVSVWFTLLRGTDVGLGVLVGFLHCAVVGGSSCSSSRQRGFGKQTGNFPSGLLTVVLHQTVALGALFALVVGAVVARDGGQVAVLWPDSRG